MKYIGVLLMLAIFFNYCSGQVTHTIPGDKSIIYYHSLDTVLRLIEDKVSKDKVIVYGDYATIIKLPDATGNQPMIKVDKTRLKKLKPKKGERIIVVYLDGIIEEQGLFSIRIRTMQQTNKSMGLFADTLYVIRYRYDLQKHNFELADLRKGLVL
jgi:hypothetical protein